MVAFKRAVAIWAHVCVEVQPSIFFLHICSLEVYRMASWWRENESEHWWKPEDGWAQQWQKKAVWPKFEDELTTIMFTMFDSIKDEIRMLNEKVDKLAEQLLEIDEQNGDILNPSSRYGRCS